MSEFDNEIIEFLDVQRKPATRQTYGYALEAFRTFYASQGSIRDFLLRVEADEKASSFLEQKRVALNTVNDFVSWMKKDTQYKAKTMRTYAGAVQALVKYLIKDAKISTKCAGLTSSCEARKQYPWTVETVSMFAEAMNDPLYRCLVAVFFQSGISVSDALALTYGDIENKLETETVPLCLDLARTKKDTPYMTFVGSLGFQLLKEYIASRETWAKQDPLFPINKSSIERYFLRRAKKLSGIYDDDHLYGYDDDHLYGYDDDHLYGPQSLRTGFKAAMHDSGLKQRSLSFFMGSRLFSTKDIYKSKSKDEWRAEYAKHENSVTFRLPSQA